LNCLFYVFLILNKNVTFFRRTSEGDSTPELKWKSKKVSDVTLRNRLGGWTSEHDARQSKMKQTDAYKLTDIFPVSINGGKNNRINSNQTYTIPLAV
jgi:hypothetical protein